LFQIFLDKYCEETGIKCNSFDYEIIKEIKESYALEFKEKFNSSQYRVSKMLRNRSLKSTAKIWYMKNLVNIEKLK